VGGKNEEDTVERVLSASVSNELARLFNWNGMKGKRAFKKLELAKVVFGMVLLTMTLYRIYSQYSSKLRLYRLD